MSVSYSVILAIGKEFDDEDEVIDFINSHSSFKFSEAAEEEIGELGIGEFLYDSKHFQGLFCETVNCYTGYGCILGYRLNIRPPEAFADNVKEAQAKFKATFGVEGDIISAVSVY